MSGTFEAPESRNEAILQNMLGAENELLPPESRIETLLQMLLEELQNIDGRDGGESTIAWKPTVTAEGVISWTRTSSTTTPESQNIRGPQGEPGQQGNTGPRGEQGETGAAGFSPTVTIERNTANNDVIITVTDTNGTTTAQVFDGTKTSVSSLLTLSVAGWNASTKQQTVSVALDTSKRNVIDITLGENEAWDNCGVYPIAETSAGITFEAETIPEQALTFKVCSMEVS